MIHGVNPPPTLRSQRGVLSADDESSVGVQINEVEYINIQTLRSPAVQGKEVGDT